MDGDLIVNKNGGNIITEYDNTPGDVLYSGAGLPIYQDDSIFSQASGNPTSYPKPTYGTSTRRLYVVDSAGNVINDTTVDYNSNTNKTFTVVGGRTYYARAYTNFSYPTSATLSFGGIDGGSGQYVFAYYLTDAVEGDITIDGIGAISADMFFTYCSGPSEDTIFNSSGVTISKGQYGYGSLNTGYSSAFGFNSYKINNYVYIEGNYYVNGSTFVKGATTVTVSINTNCQPL